MRGHVAKAPHLDGPSGVSDLLRRLMAELCNRNRETVGFEETVLKPLYSLTHLALVHGNILPIA